MKKSDMVNKMVSFIDDKYFHIKPECNIEKLSADLLDLIEREGMLPPFLPPFGKDEEHLDVNVWEDE